jgi:hypothetical protein
MKYKSFAAAELFLFDETNNAPYKYIYDIITKEHNGTIKAESPPAGQAGKDGEGSEFRIILNS